jgi:hypothetical protein
MYVYFDLPSSLVVRFFGAHTDPLHPSHGVDENGMFEAANCCGHCMETEDTEPFTIRIPKNQPNPPNFKFVEQNNTRELIDIANREGKPEDFIVKKGRIPRIEFTLEWLLSKPAPVHQFDEPPVSA